ncbi:Pantothenate kinase [Hoyosella subflava DQS3-9A1]|uniref:Pantothenate kinase n=2 Tax=Hoyosella TaxID=697025 RepID=F6EQ29_HOYSD|nr:Pantothenate kinase [Hoyosella subflava DQS3-9A1]
MRNVRQRHRGFDHKSDQWFRLRRLRGLRFFCGAMSEPSPYVALERDQWRALRKSQPMVLTENELRGLRGLGEQIDLAEVEEVYLPLSRLIHLQVAARQRLFAATATFLGEAHPDQQVPFVIGVAGSVAVGKSTTARVLQALLARWERHPRVDLVTTDGFLYPSRELNRLGIMHRKGFPESYDRRALLRFVTEVKSGNPEVSAPVYSHHLYDIVAGARHVVRQPDILIIEGLNVLQTGPTLMVSDLFDFSVYVDARIEDIEHWYVQRFLTLRKTAFADPRSHFHHYASLNDDQARIQAKEIWDTINRPNLVENILPTRPRATLVLRKDSSHRVNRIRLRKL